MDRNSLRKLWADAWTEGLWAAAWRTSVQDLTAVQAAWTPAEGRHSIWQIVNHVIYWREHELRLAAGGPRASDEERARLNFLRPTEASDRRWQETLRRLGETQQRIGAAIADERVNIDRIRYLLPHDCYHFGQINYLRAMQGLPAIE